MKIKWIMKFISLGEYNQIGAKHSWQNLLYIHIPDGGEGQDTREGRVTLRAIIVHMHTCLDTHIHTYVHTFIDVDTDVVRDTDIPEISPLTKENCISQHCDRHHHHHTIHHSDPRAASITSVNRYQFCFLIAKGLRGALSLIFLDSKTNSPRRHQQDHLEAAAGSHGHLFTQLIEDLSLRTARREFFPREALLVSGLVSRFLRRFRGFRSVDFTPD